MGLKQEEKGHSPRPMYDFLKFAGSRHRMFANEIAKLAYFPYI